MERPRASGQCGGFGIGIIQQAHVSMFCLVLMAQGNTALFILLVGVESKPMIARSLSFPRGLPEREHRNPDELH